MKRIIAFLMVATLFVKGFVVFGDEKRLPSDIGPKERFWNMAISGDNVYLADGTAGFMTVDVSEHENPKEMASTLTGGNVLTVEAQGNYVFAVSGDFLNIYNASNPSEPVLINSLVIEKGAKNMQVQGNILLVYGGSFLQMFDISYPASAAPLAAVSGIGNYYCGYADNDYVYLITTGSELFIYDIKEKTAPRLVSKTVVGNINYSQKIIAHGDILYATDSSGLFEIDVLDKEKPSLIKFYESNDKPNALHVYENTLIVGMYNSQKIVIYDANNPGDLKQLSVVEMGSPVYSVKRIGKYIFVCTLSGLQIVDLFYEYDRNQLPIVENESAVLGERASGVETQNPFVDTKEHWAEDSIAKMYKKSVITGISDTLFVPNENVTRAEFYALAVRAKGYRLREYKGRFIDVGTSDWYCDIFETAHLNALIPNEMVKDGAVFPNAPITREEMAAVVALCLDKKPDNATEPKRELSFDDKDKISLNYIGFVQQIAELGVVSGDENNNFLPKDNLTRGESAVVVERMLDVGAPSYEPPVFLDDIKYDIGANKKVALEQIPNLPKASKNPAGSWQQPPTVFKVSEDVKPGDLISFYGQGFLDDTKIYIQPLKQIALSPDADALECLVIDIDKNENYAVAQIPTEIEAGAFAAYCENKYGISVPIFINTARIQWIDRDIVTGGEAFRIIGRNLDGRNFASALATGVALVGEGQIFNLELKSINPYCVEAVVSFDIPDGNYQVYVTSEGVVWHTTDEMPGEIEVVQNVSDPFGLGYAWAREFNWQNVADITKAPYNVAPNMPNDVTEQIQASIDHVKQHGGGVVYIPEGKYNIRELKVPAYVVLKGDGMEKTILNYINRNADVTGKNVISSDADGRTLGRTGLFGLQILLEDTPAQSTPDHYIWFGESWGTNVANEEERTAQFIFIKQVKVVSPMIRNGFGRGMGVTIVAKSHVAIEDSIMYGFQSIPMSNYISKYSYLVNNHFTSSIGNLSLVGICAIFEKNTINHHTIFSDAMVNAQGIFMRGYSYLTENVIRNTGMPGCNDGELFCGEEYRGGAKMGGNVVASEAKELQIEPFLDENGEPKAVESIRQGWKLNDTTFGEFWYIVITDGLGLGQIRKVVGLDEGTKTLFLEKEWDVLPDNTSKFVVMAAQIGITIYNNYANTGSKGCWFYGDCYDGVIAKNNLINTEGILVRAIFINNDTKFRSSQGYFNTISSNYSAGFSSKSRVNGIGADAVMDTPNITHCLLYGIEIRNNTIVGSEVIPKAKNMRSEAPTINGIYVAYTVKKAMDTVPNVLKGVIIENNKIEKMDRGITIGNSTQANESDFGTNTIGAMSYGIYIKDSNNTDVIDPLGEAIVLKE
ncbi:MAG: S-layer homology domain-containing protein [Firmicutes bacterium]|nr:S-layer homology domain-containing protein [Bacillota bacterium]